MEEGKNIESQNKNKQTDNNQKKKKTQVIEINPWWGYQVDFILFLYGAIIFYYYAKLASV